VESLDGLGHDRGIARPQIEESLDDAFKQQRLAPVLAPMRELPALILAL
jgi:hypothetical protein